MTLQGTNTYLIGTGQRRVLVDTGAADHPAYVDSLKTALDELDVKIEKVVITHWHHDHVGGVLDLMREGVVEISTPIVKIPFSEKDDATGENAETVTATAVTTRRQMLLVSIYGRRYSLFRCYLIISSDPLFRSQVLAAS